MHLNITVIKREQKMFDDFVNKWISLEKKYDPFQVNFCRNKDRQF